MGRGYSSAGVVLTWHAQCPGFDPQCHGSQVHVHACNCSTWETKASGSEVQGYFEIHGPSGILGTLSQRKGLNFQNTEEKPSLRALTHPPTLPPSLPSFCFCFCFVNKVSRSPGGLQGNIFLSFLECRDYGSELYTWNVFPSS